MHVSDLAADAFVTRDGSTIRVRSEELSLLTAGTRRLRDG